MTDHDDTLAGIDLQAWRIPPPLPFDRASLLVRALAPATMPARRRMGWLLAAIVLVNAAIVTLVVILLARPPETQVVVEPAGGVDARVGDLLQRLDQERRELETKLAEIEELRALIVELREKIRRYEQAEHDRTVPRKIDPLPLDHRPIDPYDNAPAKSDACDEVSCVLSNYDGPCCLKFKRPHPPAKVSSSGLPDALDRAGIASGIASVRAKVMSCGDVSTAKGMVKVRVRVEGDGHVVSVIVETAPDTALGSCVAHFVQKAVFERTQNGAVFGYPFVF